MRATDEPYTEPDYDAEPDHLEPEPPEPAPPLSLEEIEGLLKSAEYGYPLPESLAHLGAPPSGDTERASFARELVFELGVIPQLLAEIRQWRSLPMADEYTFTRTGSQRPGPSATVVTGKVADTVLASPDCDAWVRTVYRAAWVPFSNEPPF